MSNNLLGKKIKFKVQGDKAIFGLIRAEDQVKKPDSTHNIGEAKKEGERHITLKLGKRKRKEGSFNTGRWTHEEHKRFIEALLKFGNEWKNVQKHVGTRSSTQARSHAQKFFVKIGKTKIENLQLDFENNSLKSLNQMASNLTQEQMCKAIKTLNKIAFEKKVFSKKAQKCVQETDCDGGVDIGLLDGTCDDLVKADSDSLKKKCKKEVKGKK
jgi:SHAQKYF class myb-like DNA-binding protein